ncbi:MAG: UPF0280 family protein [Desulfobulbaceae bacterium]|nr:UPF0280 family protein [Desulfobulbaceae bacterium]
MNGGTRRKKRSESYRDRTYRTLERSGLISSFVRMVETDLHILAPVNVEDEALRLVAEVRRQIEGYIRRSPLFVDSLHPLPMDEAAPPAVREMLRAGLAADVGPMAAVAGTIAEFVGLGLQRSGIADLIVENGGDIYIARERESTIAVFAAESPLNNRVGIRLPPAVMPCGVCCSSGTVGHSRSFGCADAVVVAAPSTALADAAATRIGNEVDCAPAGIDRALRAAGAIAGLSGDLITRGDRLGALGGNELAGLD